MIFSNLTRSHDKCSFCAHSICLARTDSSAWFFLCDRRVPGGKVRVVCRAHSQFFVSDLYLLYPAFPQISLLAKLACEIVLAASAPAAPPDPRGSLATPHMETRSHQKPFLPRTSERRSRRRAAVSPVSPSAGQALEESVPPAKRSARRPAYTVRQFVQEVEEMLSFETGAAFWPGFQRSADEGAFQEVAPCVLGSRKAGDYAEERNVLWNWCDERLLHRCSETAGTKLVRVLLQGFYTAELLLCVKPLEEGGPAGSVDASDPRGGREIGVWWTPLANETANCRETWKLRSRFDEVADSV